MNVAASHSEYQIYLINIAPIYDKKNSQKNLEIMLCFQFLLRRLITSMMLLPTIVYYYKKHTLPRMLKYFQVIKISKKKNQVIWAYLRKIKEDYKSILRPRLEK